MHVVYAEDVFLNNGAIAVLLLYTSAWAVHRRIGWARLALGGALAGGWALAAVCRVPVLSHPLLILPLSGLLVYAALHPRSGREWLRMWAAFLAATFALGGTVLALACLGREGAVTLSGLPAWMEAVSIVVLVALLRILSGLRHRPASARARIRIRLAGRTASAWAVCDTGNQLAEPISGWPAVAVSLPVIAPLLTEAQLRAVRKGEGGEGVRMIPYRAFGGAEGLLVGVRPDWIEIRDNGTYAIREAYLAICPEGFLRAEALVNPGIYAGLAKGVGDGCRV